MNAKPVFWMIWFEDGKADKYPVQTFIEGVAYYADKYGHVPNRAEVPVGIDLTTLADVADGMDIKESPTVLSRHIYLTFDPGTNGSKT